jgi:hypothetical protein
LPEQVENVAAGGLAVVAQGDRAADLAEPLEETSPPHGGSLSWYEAGLAGARRHAHRRPGDARVDVQPERPDGDVLAPVEHHHAEGDAAVRGTAANLHLWLWGRVRLDRLGVFGDPAIAERLTKLSRV